MTLTVHKVPAVHADLEIGYGLTLQQRGPLFNFEQRIELNWIFRTVDEIKELDITKYTRVQLHQSGATIKYWYDIASLAVPDDINVIKPDSVLVGNQGRWVIINESIDIPTGIHNELEGLQGGNGVDEFYHLTARQHQDVTTTCVGDFSYTGYGIIYGGRAA